MDPLVSLHLAQDYEDPKIQELTFFHNANLLASSLHFKRSGKAVLSVLSVLSAAWVMGAADAVSAKEPAKEFVPVILTEEYLQSYAGGGYYYILVESEDDRLAYAVKNAAHPPVPYQPVRPVTASSAAVCDVFKYGDSGPGVNCLQELLAKAGYFHDSPTGYFGPKTRDAVIAFQRDYGLLVDGVAGPETLTVLHQIAQ